MPVIYRPATIDDSQVAFKVFLETINDLSQRLGVQAITGGNEPEVVKALWESRRSLFEHLARTAEHFWLAEEDGQAVGYARSILRDGVRELTEFFVRPGHQSAGVGRELLTRAFPLDGAKRRVIIAATDSRAQARYLKTGVCARFPIYFFGRQLPEGLEPSGSWRVDTDLTFEPISPSPETYDTLRALDVALLGHRRDIDHDFFMQNQTGFLYRRNREAVGFGYLGKSNGPFGLLNEADFPAVLAHAESQAAGRGDGETGFEVPLVNRAAASYLLSRGYRMDSFFAFLMSNAPFGKFENYIFLSPPFFM